LLLFSNSNVNPPISYIGNYILILYPFLLKNIFLGKIHKKITLVLLKSWIFYHDCIKMVQRQMNLPGKYYFTLIIKRIKNDF